MPALEFCRSVCSAVSLGSLSKYDGEAKENVDRKSTSSSTYEFHVSLVLFCVSITSTCKDRVQFSLEMSVIHFRGHVTLLCRIGRQRNVPSFITSVQRHCSPH